MKKITLTLVGLLFVSFMFSQSYTTGLINLSNIAGLEYSARIDVNSTTTTLTMIGPENRWLGLGFGVISMTSGEDVIIFNGETLTDRFYGFEGQTPGEDATGITPTEDAEGERDWTVQSNDVNAGVRTLVATRANDTGNPNDYVFSASAISIELAWARARFDGFDLEWHGIEGRGVTMQSFTLNTDDIVENDFQISPNPAKNNFTVDLKALNDNTTIEVYDVLGKKILNEKISVISSSYDISSWNSGLYIIRISSENSIETKRFIKN